MNPISNILAFACILSTALSAQVPEVGFVRIVNAIPQGEGKATFHVDGDNLYPEGYALGQDTGGYGIKSGGIRIEVRKQGLRPGKTTLDLATGETITLIAFAEKIDPKEIQTPSEPQDPDTPQWKIRLLKLKQHEMERGFGLSFVSVCDADEVPVDVLLEQSAKPRKAFAKRLTITRLELGSRRSEIQLKSGDRDLGLVSTDSPGNYVVILYQNESGDMAALSFYDPKFVVAG